MKDTANMAITSPMRASRVAAGVFVVVFAIFGVAIVVTSVINPAGPATVRTVTDSTITSRPAGSPTPTITTVTTEHLVTTVTPVQGVTERLIASPFWILFQLLLALAAAFLAAGATQRVLLGRFGFALPRRRAAVDGGPITEETVAAPGAAAIAGVEALLSATGRARAKASLEARKAAVAAEAAGRGGAAPATLEDPNLQLAGLRISIERRIRQFAEVTGMEAGGSARIEDVVHQLESDEALPREVTGSLEDLMRLGTTATHGGSVSPSAAAWARTEGLHLLSLLDALIAEVGANPPRDHRASSGT